MTLFVLWLMPASSPPSLISHFSVIISASVLYTEYWIWSQERKLAEVKFSSLPFCRLHRWAITVRLDGEEILHCHQLAAESSGLCPQSMGWFFVCMFLVLIFHCLVSMSIQLAHTGCEAILCFGVVQPYMVFGECSLCPLWKLLIVIGGPKLEDTKSSAAICWGCTQFYSRRARQNFKF